MKKQILGSILGVFIFASCIQSGEENTKPTDFKIEILDDEALKLIDPNAEIKVMASGFTWTEGPLWVDAGNFLLFSDIPNNKVYKLDANGDTSLYLHPAGYTGIIPREDRPGSNGLTLNPSGELVLLQHGDRRVAKMSAGLDAPKSDFVTLVDRYQGKRLNSPNDGVFDKTGNFYFTDPPYGLSSVEGDPAKELSFQGVYCLTPKGELLLLDSLSRPNGITLSPDGTTLYVAVSDPQHAVWYQYDVQAPGQVNNKRLFYDVGHFAGKEGHQGMPDGMKVNKEGYMFATGPGGVWIFNQEAKPLARIYTGQLTSNCAFGHNEKQLFLTADDYILSVALK